MATIRDVARETGVSTATVSRVFNGSSRVSDETRRRVWATAAELDYWPNGAARSLTTSRSHALGVLLPDLYGEFFSEVIRGIDHAARRAGFQVLLSSSHADTEAVISTARSMRGRVDGLIVMAPDEASAEAIHGIARRFPVVLLTPRLEAAECSTVSIANYEGAYAVVDHLIRLGHRVVATITGPRNNVHSDERLRGYRQALADAGIASTPSLEVPGDFTESFGFEAADEIFRHHPRPTAVFAANDSMAIGLLSALGNAGIEISSQMAVAGFDDIAIAQYVRPPLTTVHVDAYQLGARTVDLLTSSLVSPDSTSTRHETLPATLVVRRSCGSSGGYPSPGSDRTATRAGGVMGGEAPLHQSRRLER